LPECTNDFVHAGRDFIGNSVWFLLVSRADGRFLLHQRGKYAANGVGSWDFGAGKIEWGEDFEAAVGREMFEEYGCRAIRMRQLRSLSNCLSVDGEMRHWIVTPFVVLVNRDEVRNMEPDKLQNFTWRSLEDLPKPLHPMTQRGVELLRLEIQSAAEELRSTCGP
jgi:8-oxo-dGTP diphosphatase